MIRPFAYLIILLLTSCSIFDKQARQERKQARIIREATKNVAFLKQHRLLADTCHANYPCVTKDSTTTESYDSTEYIASIDNLQFILNKMMHYQDSLQIIVDSTTGWRTGNELGHADTGWVRWIIPKIQPVVITKTVEKSVEDYAHLDMMDHFWNDSIDRVNKRMFDVNDNLKKAEIQRDNFHNDRDSKRQQRNILFLLLIIALLIIFRKPIVNNTPLGKVSFISKLFK
jgi:hypothetical protein